MNSTSLESLKAHLFETLEGVKNLNDPQADDCEKMSIEQAKQIVDVADAIVDVYKVQLSAVELAHKMDNVNGAREIIGELGIADTKLLEARQTL